MAVNSFFSDRDVILGLHVRNKRELFKRLAGEAAQRGNLSREAVLEALNAREKIGSTALGKGVGLPHAELPMATAPLMIFVRLDEAIDFDAQDEEPVDLIFLALWPESSSKEVLAGVSALCRVLRDPQTLRRLRQAEHADAIVRILHDETRPPSKPAGSPGD